MEKYTGTVLSIRPWPTLSPLTDSVPVPPLPRAAHPEHRAALGSGSVDPLLEHLQSDAALRKIGAKRDQVHALTARADPTE
ncbi:hypothetical protein [Rhodococcus jostii]|uniref:hypothetical protein n=1 Tax=Rhodococcus jostii TaxID=132919 RepID=UPI001F074C5B|nr:hypothetical protein [Rhodococcus jostii]